MVNQSEPPESQSELDEALLALEELIAESPEEALAMFETLPPTVASRVEFQLSKARAHQALGELNVARDLCTAILAAPVDDEIKADIHHLLADLLEDLGESEAANEHFVSVLRLDRLLFETSRHVPDPKLTAKVSAALDEALASLPAALRSQVSAQLVQLFPSEEDVLSGLDPRGFTAYSPGSGGGTFRVFAANLDAEYGDLDELDEFDEHIVAELKAQLLEQLAL